MDPFKVLHLEAGADKQAVKRAYFRLIRQYRPEEEPEKFKEIREAYEYLQEAPNLVTAQKITQIPTEFRHPYNQVLEWIKKEEYDKAIALCERVLDIVEILEFRILLGKAYILNDNSGKAVRLWEGLCQKDSENIEYREQLGKAYWARGWNNKAFQIYCTLYEKGVKNLSFYDNFMDIAAFQESTELVCRISLDVFEYYRSLENHAREDAESMSSILWTISEYVQDRDYEWLLGHSDEIFDIMTETPLEFSIYEDTIMGMCTALSEILEVDEAAGPVFFKYGEYVVSNENNISERGELPLTIIKANMEKIKIEKDPLIHEIIKEASNLWYGLLTEKAAVRNTADPEISLIKELLGTGIGDGAVYDTLLYMVNDLKNILPGLQRVKKEYPVLRQAMGEFLEEMLNCSSQQYLFNKYEKKYKKLMGYPSGARLMLSSAGEDDYDAYENGTYRREEAKIGRNDPCPCGSGKKYKKCCGRNIV